MPPVASTLQTPTEYADELKALCLLAVAEATGGAIDREYLSPGRPAHDCEQLTVALTSIGEAETSTTSALGGGRRHVTGRVNLLGFLVTVLRDCVPVIEDDFAIPPADEINASAVEVQEDAWAIWTRIYQEHRAGELFDGHCSHLFFDGARAIETEGSLAGWEIEFRAEIPGIIASGS